MKQQLALAVFVLLSNVHQNILPLHLLTQLTSSPHDHLCVNFRANLDYIYDKKQALLSSSSTLARQQDNLCSILNYATLPTARHSILLADAKGVAGLGKAGGDGQGGSDKAGQQVPPEVYKALTYAGSLFLLTLSVPLILYGLNKLLNKIEDCFGCGPSSARGKLNNKQNQKQFSLDAGTVASNGSGGGGLPVVHDKQPQNNKRQLHQNQKYHLQLMHQQPKCYNFTPLQEFDVSQCNLTLDNQQRNIDNKPIQQQQSSSPLQPSVNPCAINISSDLETLSVANMNKSEVTKTSPISESSRKKSIDYNNPVPHKQSQQFQQRPFIISSPHL